VGSKKTESVFFIWCLGKQNSQVLHWSASIINLKLNFPIQLDVIVDNIGRTLIWSNFKVNT
jgi:hypothetical protein